MNKASKVISMSIDVSKAIRPINAEPRRATWHVALTASWTKPAKVREARERVEGDRFPLGASSRITLPISVPRIAYLKVAQETSLIQVVPQPMRPLAATTPRVEGIGRVAIPRGSLRGFLSSDHYELNLFSRCGRILRSAFFRFALVA
jgi:hypothetical protein